MSAAERMRRHRARLAAGQAVLRVPVDRAHVETILEAAGYLPPWSDPSLADLGAALAELVADLVVGTVARNGGDSRSGPG